MGDNDFCSFLVPSEKKGEKKKEVQTEDKFVVKIDEKDILQSKHRKPERKSKKKVAEATDVFCVHERVKKAIIEKETNVVSMKQRISDLEWIRDHSKDQIEVMDAKQELFHRKKELLHLQNVMDMKKYEERINPILEEYKEILYNPTTTSFVESVHTDEISTARKIELEYIFYSIAREYISIKPYLISKVQTTCQGCGGYEFDSSDDGVQVCTKCGAEVDILDDAPSFRDTMRINLVPRYSYSRRGHMKEAIDKHQCKQHTTIPDSLYDMLDEECEINKIENINPDQILRFLKKHKHKYSCYYEDLNLIYYTYTKKTPPDLSMYVEDILRLNDVFEDEYERLKIDNNIPGLDLSKRSSALNVQYKLYILLKNKLGYMCTIDEFYTLRTRDKFIEHDLIAAEIFGRLQWKWTPNI